MIKNISFQFQLFDEDNQPINKLPVFIQYYNMEENQWISIYKDELINGQLFIEEKATSRAKSLNLFLGKIKANEIPELRIVPEKPIFELEKQQVLSITYEFELLREESILRFSFGSAWMLEQELIAQNDRFKTFHLITSLISLVNQRENVAIIADLNKKLTACHKRNEELVQKNNQLEASVISFSQQWKLCEASKKEIEKRLNEQIKKLQAEINGQSETIRDLNNQLKQCEASRKELEERFTEQIKKLKTEIDKKSETIIDLNNKLNQCEASKKELENQIKELQAEIVKKSETIRDLNNQVKQCEASKKELIEDFNEQINELQNQINDLQAQIEELLKEIEIDDRPIAVKSIYKNLVQEMDTAVALSKNNNYSLANLSIKLKGLINQDANNNVNIQLFSKDHPGKINGNLISDISFDIIPTPTQNFEAGKTPNVLGLTETAVTRILDSLGLKLNPVYQNKTEVSNGASFKQTPQAGKAINPNEFVTVIFSRNE